MTLSDLYPPGTKLVDVPPDFHGMPHEQWERLKLQNQFDRYREACDREFREERDWKHCKGREWRGRALHSHRDDYGSKALPKASTLDYKQATPTPHSANVCEPLPTSQIFEERQNKMET